MKIDVDEKGRLCIVAENSGEAYILEKATASISSEVVLKRQSRAGEEIIRYLRRA